MFRPILTIVNTIIATIILGSIALIVGLFDRSGNFIGFCARFWSWIILRTAGISVRVDGLEKISKGESYVFMCNHESLVDIPALVVALPFQLRFLTKKELFRIPLFGQVIKVGGHVSIDRSNLDSAIASLNKASLILRRQKASSLVFAEGTRSVDGKLARFKKGGVILALTMQAPIVPVSVSGTKERARKKSLIIRSGKVVVTIGDPIETAGLELSDRNRLVEEARNGVIKNLENAISD